MAACSQPPDQERPKTKAECAVPVAILTAHGQPSAPEAPEKDLADLAAQVAHHLEGWDMRSATLSTPGKLQSVAEKDAVVFPFFMSGGYFTTSVLPQRLEGIEVNIAPPFGLDSDLAPLAARAMREAADRNNWTIDNIDILLAAHGSARGPMAAAAAYFFARALCKALPGPRISCGFVEQAPSIADAARHLPEQSFCVPFFAQAGDHVRDDVPEALEYAGFRGETLPVVGALPGVPELIARALQRYKAGQTDKN